MINDNLKFLYDEQQAEKREREERRKRKQKKKAKQIPKFHVDMSTPNFWDLEEEEDKRKTTASSAGEGTSRDTGKLTSETKSTKSFKVDKPFESKKEVMTLEKVASRFPSFIFPSINNQNKAHILKDVTKYPRIEEDLFAANTSGYILDLDNSSNPGESIRI